MSRNNEKLLQIEHLVKHFKISDSLFKKEYVHAVEDVSFFIYKGETLGLVGESGCGKTTLMKILCGIEQPDSGAVVTGQTIKLGYYAQEIRNDAQAGLAYMKPDMRVIDYIRNTAEYVQTVDGSVSASVMLDRFLFPPEKQYGLLGKLSGGERRRLNLLRVLMEAPNVLILDEPTSGLDPVMQEVFIDFIRSEKKRGKTILLSSHMFHEVDAVCDRIAIIKEGRIAADFSADELKEQKQWIYKVSFETERDYNRFNENDFLCTNKDPNRLTVRLMVDGLNRLIPVLSGLNVTDISEIPYTLEDHFMKFYKKEDELQGEPEGGAGIWEVDEP